MRYIILIVFIFIGVQGHAQDILMQNGTFNRCQPNRFFDSGGEFGNYGNDENLVTTICPQNAGEFMVIEFLSFATQLNLDVLTIYDGDSTAAPVIGTYSGAASPGTVSASTANATGCLTFQFISSATGNTTGWEATIGCATPCQTITASIDTTTPEPNPSGVIVILPSTEVTFNGSATFSEDGTNATYDWDFADGNTATGTTASNIFNNPGTFNVTLTVTDDNPQSCTDVATITVVVIGDTVIVDQDSFTPEELVEDVLINSECATVTNIISSTGIDFSPTEPNGIGYFISDGNNFEFAEGIILTTGDASRAEGPEQGTLSDGSFAWPGDNDLENAIGLGLGATNNATFIQFDFVPLANEISFDFVFASEEYGQFQCSFTDAFAFLLTNNDTGVTTNLALVPGTTDVVSVLNVRDNAFNAGCPSVNPNFFDSYYGNPNGQPVGDAPIDFRGYTIPMTAESIVTPGTSYTIKLVIADDQDTQFDAAVFLEAGSFNLGGDLGDDITIAAGTAECGGEAVTLDTGLPTATHTWFQDGVEIPGETGSTIDVTQTGTYSVEIEFSGSCQTQDSIFVEFKSSPTANQPQDLTVCDVDGTAEFDLSENDDDILGAQDPTEFIVSYHLTEDDAINNLNPLPINYTNATNPQTIWARISDATQECFDTTSFQLLFSQLDINANITPIELCDDVITDGLTEFNLLDREAEILGTNDPADVNISFHLNQADAENDVAPLPNLYTNVTPNNQTIFVRLESVISDDCYNVTTLDLVVLPNPVATQPTDFEVCDVNNDGFAQFALDTKTPEIDGGQAGVVVSYHLTPGDVLTGADALPDPYTNAVADAQEVYVRVEDTATGCFATTTLQLVVHPSPTTVATDDIALCDENNPGDLQEVFDLSVKDIELIDGQANVAVSYYPSQADADAQTNEITGPYANTATPQTIVAVLTNTLTGCSSQVAFDIIVDSLPTAVVPTPLEVCDDGVPDGITEIDLSLK
ncbi:choice-of-anchor L domain-containing protein, partial [uncultured Winogradskyella sp.]|uniref:choice-of-anchor L domain-containing protein n=1 Tax=uncultured Winogradskyella sp. TaxID=395353 RepID=UPI0035198017